MKLRVDPGDRFWLATLLVLLAFRIPLDGDDRGFVDALPEKLLSVAFKDGGCRGGGGGTTRWRDDDMLSLDRTTRKLARFQDSMV